MKRRLLTLFLTSFLLTGCFSPDQDESSHSSSTSITDTSSSSESSSSSSSSSTNTSTSTGESTDTGTIDTGTTDTGEIIHHYSDTYVNTDPNGHYHMCIDIGFEDLHDGIIPHTFNEEVIEPTYSSSGFTRHFCTICGYEYRSDDVPHLYHNYSDEWSFDERYHWHQCIDAGYEDLTSDEGYHNIKTHEVEPIYDRAGYFYDSCELCDYVGEPRDYYYDDTYTSIYDINKNKPIDETVTTFGVITSKEILDGQYMYTLQCSDKDGNEAGLFLHSESDCVDINEFVIATGEVTIFNNMILVDTNDGAGSDRIESASNLINYEVPTCTLEEKDLTRDMNSDLWAYYETIGQIRVKMSFTPTDDAKFGDYILTNPFAPFGGTEIALVTFNYDNCSDIVSYFDANIGEEVTITGYLSALSWSRSNPSSDYDYESTCLSIIITSKDDISVGDPTRVKSVSLDQSKIRVPLNQAYTLHASVLPDTAINKSVTWSSSDESIATVSNAGVVRAVSEGIATITVTTVDGNKTATCKVLTGNVIDLDDYTPLNITTMVNSSKVYDTYTTKPNNGGITFSSYRWGRATGASLGKLYAHTNRLQNVDDGSLQGAFYNLNPFKSAIALEITYKSSGQVKISYGDDFNYENVVMLDASSSFKNEIIYMKEGATFIKIETQDYDVYLDKIVYYQDTSYKTYDTSYGPRPNNDRLAIEPYQGSLTEGLEVEVPMTYTKVDDTHYTVTSTKTYTYYSFSYVQELYNNDPYNFDPAKYAIVDPVDVANYYAIFQEIPANYGAYNTVNVKSCGSKSAVNNIFGTTYARCVSQYNKNSGYATSVPVNTSADGFYYFEIDIASYGGYATSSRDVGRVVTWINGFDKAYSDGYPTSVLTLDHYTTFQEYLGCGRWGDSFDVNNSDGLYHRVNNKYISNNTLVEA